MVQGGNDRSSKTRASAASALRHVQMTCSSEATAGVKAQPCSRSRIPRGCLARTSGREIPLAGCARHPLVLRQKTTSTSDIRFMVPMNLTSLLDVVFCIPLGVAQKRQEIDSISCLFWAARCGAQQQETHSATECVSCCWAGATCNSIVYISGLDGPLWICVLWSLLAGQRNSRLLVRWPASCKR